MITRRVIPAESRGTVLPVRRHDPPGSYPDADLTWWADRIREWNADGQNVFVYFNNDGNANAVRNARTLRLLLDQ
jgi:uncharacterized protein YecE (DUF72 family)